MTSLFSGTVSPSKDGTSSLPRRQNSLVKPPLRALYDLLIAPMEGVSGSWDTRPLGIRTDPFTAQCTCAPFRTLSGRPFLLSVPPHPQRSQRTFFTGCLEPGWRV